MMRKALLALLLLASTRTAFGHALSHSQLELEVEQSELRVEWAIALRDLDALLAIDTNGDGRVSSDEIARRSPALIDHVLSRLELRADGALCPPGPVSWSSPGDHLVFRFSATCPAAPRRLELRYDLFFEHDAAHKGRLRLGQGGQSWSAVFSANARERTFTLGSASGTALLDYVVEGIWHIWLGYDHVLFLLTLLLPVVVAPRPGEPDASRRAVLGQVIKTVTAFTIAHSLTLSLAALAIVAPPPRLVESAIAASIMVAALRNLVPIWRAREFVLAFAFGLLHGFGFAGALSELGLARDQVLPALFGFNCGVELGQLALVAAFVPIAFVLRGRVRLARWSVRGGSSLALALAGFWFVERASDISLSERAREAWARATWAHSDAVAAQAAEQWRAGERASSEGHLATAHEHYERASALYERAGDRASVADLQGRIGDLQLARAELEDARAAHQRALALRTELHDLRGMAAQYRSLELVARVRGELPEALRMRRRALELAEELKLPRAIAEDSAGLAAIYRETGELDAAASALARSVELYEMLGLEDELAEHLSKLAAVQQLRGELAQAGGLYRRALALQEATGRESAAASTLANAGNVAREEGDLAEARQLYRRALTLFERTEERAKAERVRALLAALGPSPSE